MLPISYDVIIIGGGIIGCSLAYRLSRYDLDVLVIEKENDVGLGATRANSAIVHGGYDPEPGTLMAAMNVRGVGSIREMVKELDVEYRETGSFVVAFSDKEILTLERLMERGRMNGVKGLEIWTGDEIRALEGGLSSEIVAGLYVPNSGVISPWEFALAQAEVAQREGVRFLFSSEVVGITSLPDSFQLEVRGSEQVGLESTTLHSRFVVNAAGCYSDVIHNMVAPPAFHLVPTRGEYYLLDRAAGEPVHHVIFQCPNEKGKGVLVAPTVHHNTLVGPNAEKITDPDDTSTTTAGLDEIAEKARRSVPDLAIKMSIRNYAGVRANPSDLSDFLIDFACPGFLDCAAIKSPGLTAAPAIAEHAVGLLNEAGLVTVPKPDWDGKRKVIRLKDLSASEIDQLIAQDERYGRVICRCESITEGEIVAALHRGHCPPTLDAVKRRAGTGMGRCQGGFCGPKLVGIIARELGVEETDVLQDRDGSYILTGETGEG